MRTPGHFGGGHFGSGHFGSRYFRPDDDVATIEGSPIPPARIRQGAVVELVGVEVHLFAAPRLEVDAVQNPTAEELALLLIALEEDGAL